MKQITGVSFDVEVDWLPFYEGISGFLKENLGSFLFDLYVWLFSSFVPFGGLDLT